MIRNAVLGIRPSTCSVGFTVYYLVCSSASHLLHFTVRNVWNDRFYDSPPPKAAVFFNERFVAARYEEGCYEKYFFTYVLVRGGLSIDDVGVAKGTVFRSLHGRGLLSKPAIWLEKNWGATVE